MGMNKAESIESIAAEAKISKADAKRALDAFVNNTTKALKKGDRVALVGFGTFSVTKRAARKGRNPQTGKETRRCQESGEVQGRCGLEQEGEIRTILFEKRSSIRGDLSLYPHHIPYHVHRRRALCPTRSLHFGKQA